MWENDNPGAKGEFPKFIEKTKSCAPLNGNLYEAGQNTVHKALASFTTGQTSEDCIKATLSYKYGNRSIRSLRNQFSGIVNATRNISKVERLHDSLHYN